MSLARKAATPAISSGRAFRCMRMRPSCSCVTFSLSPLTRSVSVNPGARALTRMPTLMSSRAIFFVAAITAALEAE